MVGNLKSGAHRVRQVFRGITKTIVLYSASMNITNKIALVTGSSRGLGRNMALALAANGADIVITYRNQKAEAESVCTAIENLGRKAACLSLDAAQAHFIQ